MRICVSAFVLLLAVGVAFGQLSEDQVHNINDLATEILPSLHHDELQNGASSPESENELSANGPPEVGAQSGDSGSSSYAIGLLSKVFRYFNLRKLVKNVQKGRSTPFACYACKFAMSTVKYLINDGKGFNDVAYVTSYFCKKLNVQTPRVCEGYVNNFMEEFVVVMSKVDLSSPEICGTLLGNSCSQVNKLHNWTLPIPQIGRLRKSLLSRPFKFRWPFSNKERKPLKVLQISDIHIDPDYSEGANAVCGEPLCCRRNSPGSNKHISSDRKAGYWGDYRDCDIPIHTVEETFRAIRDNHQDIDYILWTGDIPPHDIWNQTRESQLALFDIVDKLFQQYFDGIPIFPVVGNHESLPMNSFPQPSLKIAGKYSKNWLYEKLSDSWSQWLPVETQATIEKGAFYAVNAKSGLKIISLNTNFCNNQNWWLLLNSTDPGQQIEWLIEQLVRAEEAGEMVHIIGHVPPGSNDCIQMWSRNYNRVINRFAHIIKGQFFGHTHNDEFEIFYEDMTPHSDPNYPAEKQFRATNVAYIGPSITTFGNVNPGYRIYSVDPDTFDIVDHHTYFMNLTEANLNRNSRPVQFTKAYSAKKAYGLKSLSANEWHKLVMRMHTPTKVEDQVDYKVEQANKLFKQFYRYFYNLSDNIGEDNKCTDETCKYEILCRLLTAFSHDSTICRHFLFS